MCYIHILLRSNFDRGLHNLVELIQEAYIYIYLIYLIHKCVYLTFTQCIKPNIYLCVFTAIVYFSVRKQKNIYYLV